MNTSKKAIHEASCTRPRDFLLQDQLSTSGQLCCIRIHSVKARVPRGSSRTLLE
jgi:hypothetical protein